MSDIIDAVLELAGDITFLTEDGFIDRKSVIDFLSGIENLDPKTKGSIVMYIESLPAVHPNHIADIGKKVSISCGRENDAISREAAIEALARMMPRSYTPDGSHPADEEIFQAQEVFVDCIEALEILPSVQPEIIRCKDCDWWTKQEDSVQGRCELMQMYPAGGWYCGNARRRPE